MKFDFQHTIDALPRLLEGALVTIEVSFIGFALSLCLATLLTIARHTISAHLAKWLLEPLLSLYVSFVRGTPLLIQIFLIYYVLPIVGIDIGPVVAGIAAITLNSAAYILEIFRGTLHSIPSGQIEAARSLGLNPIRTWRHIILPQLLIRSIPPLVNEFTLVLKSTPLLATITVVELMRVSQQIFSANFRPVEVLTGAFLLYFIICFAVSRLAAQLETRLASRMG